MQQTRYFLLLRTALLLWLLPALGRAQTTSFAYIGGIQTYLVPAGVTRLQVVATGASGGEGYQGGVSGKGAQVQATVVVTPGETLTVMVGGRGSTSSFSSQSAGGYNGGGSGGTYVGSGGGATDLRRANSGGTTDDYLTTRNALLVAGAGAGAGASSIGAGGTGGTPNGGSGANGSRGNAGGSTQLGPGSGNNGGTAGTTNTGGQGESGNSQLAGGGGGGGGYYGGGGGGAGGGSGGGGSSWATASASNVSYSVVAAAGNGSLTLTPTTAPAPTITSLAPVPNAKAAPASSAVQVTFSQALATSSATALKVFSAQRGGLRTTTMPATVSGNQLSFTPSAYPYRPGETVSATVTTAAQSTDGASLATPYVYQFTTAAASGGGAFGPKNDVTPGGTDNPSGVALGDVNNDGKLDLITTDDSNNQFIVQLGDGAGGFGAGTKFPAGNIGARSLALGDFNGDGNLDVVIGDRYRPQIAIALGNGTGGFAAAQLYSYSSSFNSDALALGDVNGDGRLDVVVASQNDSGDNGYSVLLGTGTGAVTASPRYRANARIYDIALGDVNGDGKLDLVTAGINTNSAAVLLGTGTGTFGNEVDYPTAATPSAVALGDVNGDGKLDIVTGNYTAATGTSVLLGTGTGSFGSHQDFATGVSSSDITLGDVDGDGALDIVALGSSNAAVLRNTGGGRFAAAALYPTSGNYALVLGDVNSDGRLDIAASVGPGGTSTSGVVSVLLNVPPPAISSFTPTSGPVGTQVAITGTGFTSNSSVRFNGTAATAVTVNSATSLTATVPSGATTGPITVAVPSGNSTATSADAFTVTSPPTLTTVVRDELTTSNFAGLGGSNLADNGSAITDKGVVYVQGTGTPSLGNGTQQSAGTGGTQDYLIGVTGLTPSTTYSVRAYATNGVGTGYGDLRQFTTPVPAPTAAPVVRQPADGSVVNSATPTYSGAASNRSTVTVYVDGVRIGTTTATNNGVEGVFSLAQPAGLPLGQGPHTVYATAQLSGNAVSPNSNTNTFTVDTVAPTVTLSSAAGVSGSTTSTTPLPFTATFSEAVTGLAASGLTVTNGTVSNGPTASGSGTTTYTFTVTPTTAGTATTVAVAANAAQDAAGNPSAASATYALTYRPGPAISSFTPTSGPAGTQVTVTGTDFTNVTAVSFNGTAAASFTVTNATSLTATVAAGTTTGPLRVTTSAGMVTSASNFTVTATPVAPVVSTATPSNVTSTSATLGGTVSSEGSSAVTTRGVVYSSSTTTPTLGGSGTTTAANGSGAGSFSAPITGLTPGTAHTVRAYATNSVGTSYGASQSFTTPATLALRVSSQTNVACNGGTTGAATVAASGGTAPYAYSWSPSVSTTTSASNLAAGTYTVTVTDATGATASTQLTITEPTALGASVAVTNASSNGANDGAATATASGGTAPYRFAWQRTSPNPAAISPSSGTTNSSTITGQPAGNYSLTLTDANGCATTRSFTIGQPAAPMTTAAPVLASPADGSTTSATPTYQGTAPAGSTVTVFVDGSAIGTTPVTTGGSFSLTQPTALSQGSHAAYATAQSSGQLASARSNVNTFTVDAIAPTATLSSAAGTSGSTTSTTPFAFTVTFSKPVTGFAASGITVSNGTVTSGPTASGSGPIYSFTVTPTTASQPTTVTIAANAARDAVGNGNAASAPYTLTYQAPVVITATSWTGAVSTDWFDAANWSQGVPTARVDATIGVVSSGRYPLIISGTAAAQNLLVSAGASLTQTGGILSLTGNLTVNGTLTVTGGTVATTGSASQTLGGSSLLAFYNLTIGSAGASQATRVSFQGVLLLTGNLATNGQSLTLRSRVVNGQALDGLVVNQGGVVSGTATVQRAIDPSKNPGLGYRHYSAPVSNTTVADLATTGFTPVVNPTYNTSATPTAERPFPTVYGYDDARVSLSNNLAPFDRGFYSPQGLSDPLTVGRGYTVNIGADQLVDFQGPLNNGDLTLSLTSVRPRDANGGWQLLGNPYPAPLDYSRVADTDRPGLEGAIYVYSSTSQYAGQYRTYVNGIGNPVLPVGQAFFTRIVADQSAASMRFHNSQRLTVPNGTTFQRTAETRPLVQLTLQGAGSALLDEVKVYAQAGATADYEGTFDALKLPNPTGLNLAAQAADGQALAISGLPLLGRDQVSVPLALGVPSAGQYVLTAAQLLNLSSTPVYLRDLQLGTLTDLALTPSYAFTVANAASPSPRFELVFSPQQALATAPAALAQQVGLYPNPTKLPSTVTLVLPLSLARQAVTATLLDALGRVVYEQQLTAGLGTHALTLDNLATGVYALRLQTSAGLVVKKLVID